MAAKLLDGRKIARQIRKRIKAEVARLKEESKIAPGLAVILVGDDPASRTYVNTKKRICKRLGILSEEYTLSAETTEEALLRVIRKINADDRIHGLLVQRPLPPSIDTNLVTEAISPQKDVDCFHPQSVGRLTIGGAPLHPCTPLGVIRMLESEGFPFCGSKAVVIGRSIMVGKPLALMLLERNCTVTLCHSRTQNLEEEVKKADLLVAAAGRAGLVEGSWIKEGSWVVDVGTNPTVDGSLTGDVDFEAASERAEFITPVPGGVGPMTIAMLMENTVNLARLAGAGAKEDRETSVMEEEEE